MRDDRASPERLPWQPGEGRRRRAGMSAVILGLSLTLSAPLVAQDAVPPAAYAYRQLPDACAEAEAQALMETLRCLVCQGQSIADSDAALAGDMRSLVRRRIAEGDTPDEVRTWLIARYGDWVSYDPPLSRATWPLWAAPLVLLGLGGWLAARKLRRKKPDDGDVA